MGCRICGASPTVKAHVIPRALFHDMKRGIPLVGERQDGLPGSQVSQSGQWDSHILCAVHEGALGNYDRCGIAFCRGHAIAVEATPNAAFREIAVARPDHLVAFALACVWRKAAMKAESDKASPLGVLEKRIRQRLFEGELGFDPDLIIRQHQICNDDGQVLNFTIAPMPWRIAGYRFWRFVVRGLVFDLKLDARSTPEALDLWPVNGQGRAVVWVEPPINVRDVPGVMRSLAHMAGLDGFRKLANR